MREHFICSRMKKPLPFIFFVWGQDAVLTGYSVAPQVSRRVLLKINFIVVALRCVNV